MATEMFHPSLSQWPPFLLHDWCPCNKSNMIGVSSCTWTGYLSEDMCETLVTTCIRRFRVVRIVRYMSSCVFSSVLWCKLRFSCINDIWFVLSSIYLVGNSCFNNAICFYSCILVVTWTSVMKEEWRWLWQRRMEHIRGHYYTAIPYWLTIMRIRINKYFSMFLQGSSWSYCIWIYNYLCNQRLSPLS
jgi:hypothetical protein